MFLESKLDVQAFSPLILDSWARSVLRNAYLGTGVQLVFQRSQFALQFVFIKLALEQMG